MEQIVAIRLDSFNSATTKPTTSDGTTAPMALPCGRHVTFRQDGSIVWECEPAEPARFFLAENL